MAGNLKPPEISIEWGPDSDETRSCSFEFQFAGREVVYCNRGVLGVLLDGRDGSLSCGNSPVVGKRAFRLVVETPFLAAWMAVASAVPSDVAASILAGLVLFDFWRCLRGERE